MVPSTRMVKPRPNRPPSVRRLRRPGAVLAVAASTMLLLAPSAHVRAGGAGGATLSSAAERGGTPAQEGVISWYGGSFHDRPTASGELFDSNDMTMAHPTLPFGTQVKVTNLRNGRSVVVRVNDRGPHVGQRIADLSRAAAAELGFLKRGLVRARIEVLGEDAPAASPAG